VEPDPGNEINRLLITPNGLFRHRLMEVQPEKFINVPLTSEIGEKHNGHGLHFRIGVLFHIVRRDDECLNFYSPGLFLLSRLQNCTAIHTINYADHF
jgi:hypothetical protein